MMPTPGWPPGRPPVARPSSRAWRAARGSAATGAAEALVRRRSVRASIAATGDELAFYHYQLGEMLRGRNALAEAEAAYRAALDAQPDHVPSMGGLALVLAAGGDRDEAIRLLRARDRAPARARPRGRPRRPLRARRPRLRTPRISGRSSSGSPRSARPTAASTTGSSSSSSPITIATRIEPSRSRRPS